MDYSLTLIFCSGSYLLLTSFLAASLFFLMVGYRELKEGHLEGLLLVAFAVFFAAAHAYYLLNIPTGSPFAMSAGELNLWSWLTVLFAPALIALFVLVGLVNFLTNHPRLGLVKLFFGLTLLCFLYMLGPDWPQDVRGIVAGMYFLSWYNVEFAVA